MDDFARCAAEKEFLFFGDAPPSYNKSVAIEPLPLIQDAIRNKRAKADFYERFNTVFFEP